MDYLYSVDNNVTFERVTFTYNKKTVIIKTDDYFQIKDVNEQISFLYSDPQIIDLDQAVESYNLKFRFDLYNKDPFYLFSGTSYIPVDNCNPEGKELICNIKKETIEENLIKKGNFKMAALNDYEGYLSFNYVGYLNSEKYCSDFCALAPTHQMAMAWLREIHKLYITITHRFSHNADQDICFGYYINVDRAEDSEYITYEKAVEAALKYSLENLI